MKNWLVSLVILLTACSNCQVIMGNVASDTEYIIGIKKIFKNARTRRYPKNQIVNYAGDPLTHINFINKGYVKVYTILDSGDTRTILILGPGDLFPLAFSTNLDWENYETKYFYQTLTDLELSALDTHEFQRIISHSPDMMRAYMNYTMATNSAVLNQLEVMKSNNAIQRIAMLLPYLVTKMGKRLKPNTYQLRVKLSHQEMADLSGVTRETTTALVKKLEKKGTIKQQKSGWIIKTDEPMDNLGKEVEEIKK